ncbi:MAG: ADOP family duplicated permease [Acidobacteriota bacterium]
MSILLQDLRVALRALRRTPAFPLAAIGTLAIGIAATTAIFSTVNAALLEPLPYPDAGALYALRTELTDGRVTTGNLAPVEIVRLNDPSLSIARAAGLLGNDVTLLRDDGAPMKTRAYGVSEGFFELFGLPMTLGGFPTTPPSNDAPPSIVVSYRIWQDLFGGDPDVVGKTVRFAEVTATVAGVAPRDFETPPGANFWFYMALDPQGVNHSFEGFMRLKPGASLERARSEMAAVMASVGRDFPESGGAARVYIVRPLIASIVGELGPILVVVLAATGLLLLLACVNVTNLLLARGAARAREMAVRVALGAGRGRIVRQLLTESLLLAAAGAVAGVFGAWALVRLLLTLGASELPRLDAVAFDGRVLLFTLAVLIACGVLVGFAPALRLAATDVRALMNEGGRSGSSGRGTTRWLNALTIAEIALAVALVAGAGWLVRSFDNLRSVDPGFVAEGRLLFDATAMGPRFRDNAAALAAFTNLRERLLALPGVVASGSTFNVPLRPGPENALLVHFEGDPDAARTYNTRQRIVSPGFFQAMGVRLIAGRDFSGDDRPGSPLVVIVNRSFARMYLADRDPLTVRFTAGYPNINPKNVWTIIGVVDDVRQRSLSVAPEPAYYTSSGQGTPRRQAFVVQASAGDSAALRAAIRDEAHTLDPQMAVDIERISDIVDAGLSRQRLGMALMVGFGLAAVALAAVGIYGVIAYAAAQRRGELAVRLALGASPRQVFGLMLAQGRMLAVVGVGIGLAAAYASGRLVSSWLFEVRASDPVILGASAVVVVAITLLATMLPARRAAQLDPARVLRPD